MTDISRRRALLSGAAGIGTMLSGCLEEEPQNDDGSSDNGTGQGGTDTGAENDIVAVETLDIGSSRREPEWARDVDIPDEGAVGALYRFDGPEATDSADVAILDREADPLVEFIAETDFDSEVLLLIGTAGPNGCYNTVDVDEVRIETDTLRGQARAIEDEVDACDRPISYPWVLARVEFADDIPEHTEMTLTDGWGNEQSVSSDDTYGFEPTVVDTEIRQLGGEMERPYWAVADEDLPGVVYDVTTPAFDKPDSHVLQHDDAKAFVEETDSEREILLQIGSVGPDTSYQNVSIADVAVEDGILVGNATASTTEEPDDENGEFTTQPLAYPWALLRVEFDTKPPEHAEFTITDGWDETERVSTEDVLPLEPDQLGGYVSPDGDPPAVPDTLDCDDDEFERHPQGTDEDHVDLGESESDGKPTWALRVEQTSYERGDTVRISLTNVSGRSLGTGNSSKYNLQIRTEAGWQDIRGSDDLREAAYTDEAIFHPPGDGFDWTFELTEEGVVTNHFHEERLRVCPALQTGRYRFLCWDPAIAVEFDVNAE